MLLLCSIWMIVIVWSVNWVKTKYSMHLLVRSFKELDDELYLLYEVVCEFDASEIRQRL